MQNHAAPGTQSQPAHVHGLLPLAIRPQHQEHRQIRINDHLQDASSLEIRSEFPWPVQLVRVRTWSGTSKDGEPA